MASTKFYSIMKKFFEIIGNVCFYLVLSMLVLSALSGKLRNSNFEMPIQIRSVVSGSMEPSILIGSIVISVNENIKKINVNDIVSYKATNGEVVTHRVLKKKIGDNHLYLITKGDANNVSDQDRVNEKKLLGKVVLTIPLLGYMFLFLQTPSGLISASLIVVGLTIFIRIRKKDE
ncbi:signal peptidase I [Enterococcus camelliae]|uniref:Signal peptidase I n=1 Tax=Enterococcus camelliae TaxID=453959 RepID=A0ABW5TGY3_9ENTE